LKISDKYQVMILKAKCEKFLLKSLKVENAVEMLVLAHLYSPDDLKSKIMSFVNKYVQELFLFVNDYSFKLWCYNNCLKNYPMQNTIDDFFWFISEISKK